MYGMHYRDELPEPTARELDALISRLKAFLLREHNEDGTHNFGEGGELESSITDTIQQLIDQHQARGQWWKTGPWRLDNPEAASTGVAIITPNESAGTKNNYAPLGIDTAVGIEIEGAGDITITGIKPLEGLNKRRFLFFRNRDSSNTVTFKHENTGSRAECRFDLPEGLDLIVQPNGALWMYYDPSRDRWTAMTPESNSTLTAQPAVFGITIDGAGSVITTGVKGYVRIPFDMTITGWEIVADVSGSIVVDVWKDTYANFPPVDADSIAGTELPTLSSAQKNQDLSLSSWTTAVTAGSYIGFNVDSVSTVTRVHLQIIGVRA